MTDLFQSLRPQLFGLAYRMLGSATDAEDVLQDAYLRILSTPPKEIRTPSAFMNTVVTRLCLDRLKSAQVRRELYPGTWLREPMLTSLGDETEQSIERLDRFESLSMAFLLLLESLTPEERAVFLLREVFDYEYAEVAAMLDKSEAACRQLLSRAKKHVTDHRPRFHTTPEEHQRIFASFLSAISEGDMGALTSLLAADVTALADHGGKANAFARPIVGAHLVARFLKGLHKFLQPGDSVELLTANQRQCMVVRNAAGTPMTALLIEVGNGLITALYFYRNPEKLQPFVATACMNDGSESVEQ